MLGNRSLLFLPLAALVVAAGYLGWQMGQPLSETEVINRYAQHYVALRGNDAAVTDCVAKPDTHPDVWMRITCLEEGSDLPPITFPVAHDGLLIPAADGSHPINLTGTDT